MFLPALSSEQMVTYVRTRGVGGAFGGRTLASCAGRTPSWPRALRAAHQSPTACPPSHAAVPVPRPAPNGYVTVSHTGAPLRILPRDDDHDCLLLPSCGVARARTFSR